MALPVLETNTFELTLPSSDVKVKYRPFLVKEEKILLQALESQKQKEIVQVNDPLEESDESNLYNSSDNIMRVKSTSSSIGSCDSSNYSQQVEEGGEKKKFKMFHVL